MTGMPAEPAATPPSPRFAALVGGVLLVVGQRQLGIALEDASSLTGGSVTRATNQGPTPSPCAMVPFAFVELSQQ